MNSLDRRTDFLGFLRRPYFNDGRSEPLGVRVWLGWLGLMVIADLVVGPLGRGAIMLLGHRLPPDKAIMHLFSHPSIMVLVILLLAPVLEELVFRSFLSTSRLMVFIGSGLLFITLARVGLAGVAKQQSTQAIFAHYLTGVAMLVPLLGGYGVVWWLAGRWIMAFFQRFPVPIFWTSAALFGIIHSFNFEDGFRPWLILLTLPQISSGVFLGYIRVQHGLRWSIATHMAIDYPLTFGAWMVVLLKRMIGIKIAGIAGLILLLILITFLIYGIAGLARERRARIGAVAVLSR